jgi:hypothetical protein
MRTHTSPGEESEARRPSRRKPVSLPAIIAYGAGSFSHDCSIRDLSTAGARIIVQAQLDIPVLFFLINIPDRCAYQAKVTWRKKAETGVQFTAEHRLSAISDPELHFLKRIWFERAGR